MAVPALTITTEKQAVIALLVEVGFVVTLGVVAAMGPDWATAMVLLLVIAWALFLMGNAGALRDKFGGVFPTPSTPTPAGGGGGGGNLVP